MGASQPVSWLKDRSAVRVRLWLNSSAYVDMVGTRSSLGCVLEDLQFPIDRIVALLACADVPARIVGESGYMACLVRVGVALPNENMNDNENKK